MAVLDKKLQDEIEKSFILSEQAWDLYPDPKEKLE